MTQHKDAAPNADTAARPILWDLPGMQAANSLALTAPAFAHEAIMPPRYRGRLFRRNASSELIFGRGPLGLRGWIGPMPPQSHGPHRYVLQLFAIDRRLGFSGGFTLQAAVAAASEHVIARGRLDGFYEAHSHRG